MAGTGASQQKGSGFSSDPGPSVWSFPCACVGSLGSSHTPKAWLMGNSKLSVIGNVSVDVSACNKLATGRGCTLPRLASPRTYK